MKVTLFMAVSLNGVIARPDYREDFLSRENWDTFLDCVRRTGALIWGRKTHEKFQKYGSRYLEPIKDIAKIVVSTDPDFAAGESFERARSPRAALEMLEARGLQEATLSGGSILNTAFAREGLIDQVEINVEAVVIGRGIPLFATGDFDLKLDPAGVKQVSERIVQMRFAVRKN